MLASPPVDHQGAGLLEVMLQGRERCRIAVLTCTESIRTGELGADQPAADLGIECLLDLLSRLQKVLEEGDWQLGLLGHLARVLAVAASQLTHVEVGAFFGPGFVDALVGSECRVLADFHSQLVADER